MRFIIFSIIIFFFLQKSWAKEHNFFTHEIKLPAPIRGVTTNQQQLIKKLRILTNLRDTPESTINFTVPRACIITFKNSSNSFRPTALRRNNCFYYFQDCPLRSLLNLSSDHQLIWAGFKTLSSWYTEIIC